MTASESPVVKDHSHYSPNSNMPNLASNKSVDIPVRVFSGGMVAILLLFLFNNYLIFWRSWPGLTTFLAHQEWLGFAPLQSPLNDAQVTLGWLQLFSYVGAIAVVTLYVLRTQERSLQSDADRLSAFAAYIIRAAFWAVLIIGIADATISFLRVENLLVSVAGEDFTRSIGRPRYRGIYIHFPLILLSLAIAFFVRSPAFQWLTLLVVIAEFQIVILRFIFSYEQSFMGDLVRFWYAALFLFASAYTLVHDGHVRVDVLYAHFSKRGKAWTNICGSSLLGLPLGWVILTMGMWGKSSSLNSPIYSFEISQSGYGLYVKYIMVGFLAIFAISMIIQFSSYILSSVSDLLEDIDEPTTD